MEFLIANLGLLTATRSSEQWLSHRPASFTKRPILGFEENAKNVVITG